jgi:hypothetical protein
MRMFIQIVFVVRRRFAQRVLLLEDSNQTRFVDTRADYFDYASSVLYMLPPCRLTIGKRGGVCYLERLLAPMLLARLRRL